MTSSQRKTLFIELCEKLPYKVKVFADNMPSDESVCELVKTDGKNADLFVNKKTYNGIAVVECFDGCFYGLAAIANN